MSESLGYEYTEPTQEELDAAQAAHAALEDIRGDFLTTFGTPQGERVLTFLGDYCHQVRPTYTPGDANHTTFLEGRRSVLLLILEYMHLDDRAMIEKARDQATK